MTTPAPTTTDPATDPATPAHAGRPPVASGPLPGRATAGGTANLARRFASLATDGSFYRPLGPWTVSSVGAGSYLGSCDDEEDARYRDATRLLLSSGTNLLDTGVNYRCQRSERAVGEGLRTAVDAGEIGRDEVVVCTKGGYVPLDGAPMTDRADYEDYLRREFFSPGVMRPSDLVAGGHSLAPGFLEHQLALSRRNLGVATVDVYYVHFPEQQFDTVPRDAVYRRLRDAFMLLEERADAGEIGVYGVATWQGLRLPPEAKQHLSLAELVDVARDVAGDAHRLRVVQVPVSLAMPEAFRVPTQHLSRAGRAPKPGARPRMLTVLDAAAELGLTVVASAPLMQGRLAADLPARLRDELPPAPDDARRALDFVRSLPVASAVTGMRTPAHIRANLAPRG